MKNKNSTTRFFVSLGIFASLATVACSGGGGGNTNLTAKSDPTYASKWDTFSDVVGLPHLDQMPDLTQPDEVKKSLSTPPENFQATEKNQAQYKEVLSAVGGYILSQAPNMQTTKVISIEPYASRLNSAEVKSQRLDFMTMPYAQRGGSYSDLSAIKTASGLDAESNFEIYHTQNGQVVLDNAKTTKGKVYLITYQTGGKADQNYMALVSVPNDASSTNQKPLMIFAHGGDAGLTFKELAFLLQDNLGKFVVAAPVYPGEPICAGGFTQGSESNNYTRSCTDVNGNPVAPSIAPMGSRSPVNDDVNGLLGLANAIGRMAANDFSSSFYSGQNIFYDQNGKDSIIPFNNPYDPTKGVKTIGAADSRGGATLVAAIGRAGFWGAMNLEQKAPPYPDYFSYFSGLALIGSPSSFLVGQFRFMVQHFIHGVLPPDFKALPMVPEFMNYFEAYRNAPAGSEQEQTELKKLVGWVAASDIAFLAPYVPFDLKNWSSGVPAPGAVAFFHGTSDTVVPFTESVIAKNAFDTLFMNIYGPSENGKLYDALTVPPGTHMFSFQKDEAYLADPKATDHALAPSFLTGHILNQGMQGFQSENTVELRNAVLFGSDSKNYLFSKGSFAEQFSFYNTAFQKNVSPKLSPFIISPNCSVLKNGTCYLYLLGFRKKDHANVPLYNRTILQDTTAGVPSAMYSGEWDGNAQKSVLTPTDVLSSWIDYAILDPNAGVLQDLSSL